jgi:hypothetical protein
MIGRRVVLVMAGCLFGTVAIASAVDAVGPCACAKAAPRAALVEASGLEAPAPQAVGRRPGVHGMSLEHGDQGGTTVRWSSHGVEVEKTVFADGRFRIRIQAAGDETLLEVEPGVWHVSREGRTVDVSVLSTDERAAEAARALLAGSRAVRRFRAMAYALTAPEAASPMGAAVQLTATFLSILDGDNDAASRLRDRGRKRAPATGTSPTATASVAMMSEEEYAGPSCYSKYLSEVSTAWEEFMMCLADVWALPPWSYVCAFEWVLKVESAWFQFLACSSIPM